MDYGATNNESTSTCSPLPIPSANPVDKNSEDTVESRKRGLTEYLREAVALCDRLGSPAVTAALQRFLQPGDGGGGSSTPREDSDLVPRSELWRQVQGTVWDATGTWAFKENASVNGADALLEHRLVLLQAAGQGGQQPWLKTWSKRCSATIVCAWLQCYACEQCFCAQKLE